MFLAVVKRWVQPRSLGALSVLVLLPAAWVGCSSNSGTSPSATGGAPAKTGGAGGGGTGGAGGAGGGGTCTVPSGAVTSCASPTKPSMAFVSDFSSTSWMSATSKWGVCGNLLGSLVNYQGASTLADGGMSAISAKANEAAGNFVISGNIAASDYGGGIMAFATCGDLTGYTGVQFTLGGTGTAGCDLQFQLQTWEQQEKSNGGGCDSAVASCYNFPKAIIPFAEGVTTVKFADIESSGTPSLAQDFLKEVIGFQWHLQTPGAVECLGIDVTIDDVKLIKD